MTSKKNNNIISNIMLVVCAAVFLFSAWKLGGYLLEYKKGEDAYEAITNQAVVMPDTQEKEDTTEEAEAGEAEEPKEDVMPVIDWAALKAMNDDLVGWLYIPDTVIHYPIVYCEDNSYYLTHTFDKTVNGCGSIFMDMNNQLDFSSDNTILHGHNMKTGKMFGSLRKYEQKSYWEEHPYIYIITEDSILKYEIFASHRTTATSDVYTLEFGSEESFANYINKQSKINAQYDTGVEVTTEDHLLTLSTCTSDTEDGRRVVQAKLLERKSLEVKENGNEE